VLVDIFIPCYIDQLKPEIGLKTVALLEKAGCVVNYNTEQTCCGNPAFTSGYWDECKEVGEKLIREFPNDRYIVCPSGVCANTVKNSYSKLFYNSVLHNEYKQVQRNMFEFTDFVVNVLKYTNFESEFTGKAVYLNSCTAERECKLTAEPLKLLSNVKGLQLLTPANADGCCGFGGGFSLKYESLSVDMAKQKIESVLATGAEYIISADYTCLMHLQSYITKNNIPLQCKHIVEVL
jgi:L-lactate dehydrogenase complex protein LldE